MRLNVIGLCGGSGSGKGVVGEIFSKNGYLTIDTDKVYREITNKSSLCLDALVGEFGENILTADRKLDRRRLAKIVFSDYEKLLTLNKIAHKFILLEVRTIIQRAQNTDYNGVIVDAPLLYESGFDKECDFVVAVIAPLEERINRIIKRDNITKEEAQKRISSQKSDRELCLRADFVIENSNDFEALECAVFDIIKKLSKENRDV